MLLPVQRRLQFTSLVLLEREKVSIHKLVDQRGAESTQVKILPSLMQQRLKRNKDELKPQSKQDLGTGSERKRRGVWGTILN